MKPQFLFVDLFCGAGGTTEGVVKARCPKGRRLAKVIACINHDSLCIESHKGNHRGILHITEDIRTASVSDLAVYVRCCMAKYTAAKVILWASLECTNFSKAKGGLPRDADSRTLANDLFRYIDAINPDYVMIENVEEFMAWGELDENGKPISRRKGIYYLRWTKQVQDRGYTYDWRIMNAADYGAHTSRKRFFGVFAKKGLPISFPMPTHAKDPVQGMFGKLKKWKPVKEVLDFELPADSIFNREKVGKKKLVENTLKRIYRGLVKFVSPGQAAFMVKYYSSHSGKSVNAGATLEDPAPTLTTSPGLHLAQCAFVSKYYGNGSNTSMDAPLDTIRTKDCHALIQTKWIDRDFTNGCQTSIDRPAGSILTNPKMNLTSAYLLNPQYSSKGGSVDDPCFTLIARMDKAPPYLVTTSSGDLAIEVYPKDSEYTVKIKEFMAAHGIVDIRMRMLSVNELKLIQGFPKSYYLAGGKTAQKKFIGNAVPPILAQVLIEQHAKAIQESRPGSAIVAA